MHTRAFNIVETVAVLAVALVVFEGLALSLTSLI